MYDEDGDRVDTDTSHYNASVSFNPDETGEYTIKIRNNEDHDVDYELVTN